MAAATQLNFEAGISALLCMAWQYREVLQSIDVAFMCELTRSMLLEVRERSGAAGWYVG